jgi:hypothetical protein
LEKSAIRDWAYQTGEFTEVLSGLELDDRIVLSVDRVGVKDGATVEVEKSNEEKELEESP